MPRTKAPAIRSIRASASKHLSDTSAWYQSDDETHGTYVGVLDSQKHVPKNHNTLVPRSAAAAIKVVETPYLPPAKRLKLSSLAEEHASSGTASIAKQQHRQLTPAAPARGHSCLHTHAERNANSCKAAGSSPEQFSKTARSLDTAGKQRPTPKQPSSITSAGSNSMQKPPSSSSSLTAAAAAAAAAGSNGKSASGASSHLARRQRHTTSTPSNLQRIASTSGSSNAPTAHRAPPRPPPPAAAGSSAHKAKPAAGSSSTGPRKPQSVLSSSKPAAGNTSTPAAASSSNGKAAALPAAASSSEEPPPYHQIKTNIYIGKQEQQQQEEDMPVCSCRPELGQCCGPDDHCLNRDLLIECDPASCPCGATCQNQRLQRSHFPPTRLAQLGSKGWGLLAVEPLPAHSLVAEYLGEVVGAREKERRALQYQRAGMHHSYFMTLTSTQVIDATLKGGPARFINHSCSPNCVVEKWQVAGRPRMAVVASKAVAAGDELCYDYNMEWDGCWEGLQCACGAAGCKGVLGARSAAEGLLLQQVRRATYQEGYDGQLYAVNKTLDSFSDSE